MLKNFSKGLAVFMAMAILTLNLGIISNVSADELEGLDQSFALPLSTKSVSSPIKDVLSNDPLPLDSELTVTPPGGGIASGSVVINHSVWCSALLGVASSVSLHDNKVIDVNDDTFINLSDTATITQLYVDNNDTACQARFEPTSGNYNFNSSNYTQIDWCAGLVQGVKDYLAGSTYSPMFDLNENSEGAFAPDGIINLSDVAWAVAHNNDQAHCYLHYGFPDLTTKATVATSVPINHGAWCSALLGVMKGMASSTLRDNKVIDINGDGIVDGLDVGKAVQLYVNNDNAVCQARFELTPGNYNFDDTNYTHIDWCGGLTQGIKDYFAGSTYNSIFDLNEVESVITPDGFINASDVAWTAQHQYNNDQAHCYLHYNFPDSAINPVTEPEPVVVPPVSEFNRGGNTGYHLISMLTTTPVIKTQVLGEKVVECINKPSTTLTNFKEGTLIRACGPKIYVIKDGQKLHIENLDLLKKQYLGKRIYNVNQNVLDLYADWTPKVLGIKQSSNNKLVKSSVKVSK